MEKNSTLERITLRNTAGEAIGTIAFNPYDLEIAWRMQSVADVTEAILSPLTQIRIHPDGTTDGADAEILAEAERRIRMVFDTILGRGEGASAEVFTTVRPFAVVGGGRFFCTVVLEAMGRYIPDRIREAAERDRKGNATHAESSRSK